jgi:ABC-type dipeptide/oligopeptide/nickel transport system permease component
VPRYLLRRLLHVVPTLIGLSTLIFVLIRVVPGDPVGMMFTPNAQPTPEQLAEIRRDLGLDRPIWEQYVVYMGAIVRGDLGRSYQTNTQVMDLILKAAPATAELTIGALLIALVVGVSAGVVAATRQYGPFDYGTMVVATVGVSAPVFWIGLILIVLFAVDLRWLPVAGRVDTRSAFVPITQFYLLDSLLRGEPEALVDTLKHLALPSITLGLSSAALIARITRAALLEVLTQNYVATARAKGVAERGVVIGHALRNALIPLITVFGLQLGALLGGAVLTEAVFDWPGVGTLLVGRIEARDYPVVQGLVLFVGVAFVIVNFMVDLLYAWANPRVVYD